MTGTANTTVTWSVAEGSAGGSVTTAGLYTAPGTTGTYHVVVASQAAPTVTATATVTVTVTSVISVKVSPATASVVTSATQQFVATVTGSTNTSVTWSVAEASGCGSITQAGLYTAPAAAANCQVVATSQANGTASATAAVTVSLPGTYVTPSPVTGDVVVAMDASSNTQAISPWIYGLNAVGQGDYNVPSIEKYIPATRLGGNAATAYNWEINYYNAGADFAFTGGDFGGGNGPATGSGPGGIVAAIANAVYGRSGTIGNAALITIPVIGYAPGSLTNADYQPPIITNVDTPGVPTVNGTTGWRIEMPYRTGDPTHLQATATPNLTDDYVYQDDFLTWFKQNYPNYTSTTPAFFEMDNEPDDWGGVQQEIRGWISAATCPAYAGGGTSGCAVTQFTELTSKTIPYAKDVKDILGPSALVFGPTMASWYGDQILNYPAGTNLPNNPDGTNYGYYLDFYLQTMKAAEATYGKRLLDVLDVHMYPDSNDSTTDDSATQTTNVIATREQSPRMFWDPSFYMDSWIDEYDAIPVGNPNSGCVEGATDITNCTRQFIPRLQQMINRSYPGTKLAFTEWNWNRGADMSNMIATSDTLGIFGKYGLFFSSMFPTSTTAYTCTMAAYGAYLSYDGAGSHVGDTYLPTTVTDANRPAYVASTCSPQPCSRAYSNFPAMTAERITAYASYNSATPNTAYIVAINKDTASASLNVGFAIKFPARFSSYSAYQTTGGVGSCTGPKLVASKVPLTLTNAFNATLPQQSVTVFVLNQ